MICNDTIVSCLMRLKLLVFSIFRSIPMQKRNIVLPRYRLLRVIHSRCRERGETTTVWYAKVKKRNTTQSDKETHAVQEAEKIQ